MRETKQLNDHVVDKMKLTTTGQKMIWDSVQKGLAVCIGTNAKTLRSHYQLHGHRKSRSLGRFYEIDAANRIRWARDQVEDDRKKAANGIDPTADTVTSTDTFATLVEEFIDKHARPNQRSWKETQRTLLYGCRGWLKRPVASITTRDAQKLIDQIMSEHKRAKAQTLLRWLRKLWSWAGKRKLVPDPMTMAAVDLTFKKLVRTDTFSDQDIVAIWKATEKLTKTEAVAIKLLILIAPRRTALGRMRWQDLDEDLTLWITPHEDTKTRATAAPRVYKTPLPKLAQRILKTLPRSGPYVFPSSKRNVPLTLGSPLKRKLVRAGAPESFRYHTARHTIASYFEEESDHVVGLLLNHASGKGSVTSGYRHSPATDLKRRMLEQWCDHVNKLTTGGADNVTLLA